MKVNITSEWMGEAEGTIDGRDHPIFKNPSSLELKELKNKFNDIRFIYKVKTKALYLFTPTLFHYYAHKQLVKTKEFSKTDKLNSTEFLYGVATLKNNKLTFLENEEYENVGEQGHITYKGLQKLHTLATKAKHKLISNYEFQLFADFIEGIR